LVLRFLETRRKLVGGGGRSVAARLVGRSVLRGLGEILVAWVGMIGHPALLMGFNSMVGAKQGLSTRPGANSCRARSRSARQPGAETLVRQHFRIHHVRGNPAMGNIDDAAEPALGNRGEALV